MPGIEAAYLAHQAGWEVILIDKDPGAPATGMCDKFFQLDIHEEGKRFVQIAQEADLVIPALQDQRTLDSLVGLAGQCKCPMIFDRFCYSITSSRLKSHILFQHHEIPAPGHWPQCDLPVMVRPAGFKEKSRLISTQSGLTGFLDKNQAQREELVIQQFLKGDYYSLEVIGCQGIYRTLQVTDLDMDRCFDCKRVSAPTKLTYEHQQEFCSLGEKMGAMINLEGIANIQVVDHQGTLKVLGITAKLPSETPIVVYKSTGLNMLVLLDGVYRRGIMDTVLTFGDARAVISEYVKVTSQRMETIGKHKIPDRGPMFLHQNFFGAEEAITNYRPGQSSWVARLIHTGSDVAEVRMKRMKTIETMQKQFKIPCFVDAAPKNVHEMPQRANNRK